MYVCMYMYVCVYHLVDKHVLRLLGLVRFDLLPHLIILVDDSDSEQYAYVIAER